MGRIFGYARVSSTEQNLDRQLLELKKYVPEENIVVDKQSGKTLLRPGYQALKGALGLRAGDTLYITSLDRLSRNKEDIKGELNWFQNQGIRLMILDLPTTLIQVPEGQEWIVDMVNSIIIEVLSSIAQQEREMIRSVSGRALKQPEKRESIWADRGWLCPTLFRLFMRIGSMGGTQRKELWRSWG